MRGKLIGQTACAAGRPAPLGQHQVVVRRPTMIRMRSKQVLFGSTKLRQARLGAIQELQPRLDLWPTNEWSARAVARGPILSPWCCFLRCVGRLYRMDDGL